jgi:hypothetical protein
VPAFGRARYADAFLPMRRNPLLLRLTLRERGKMPLESPVLSMSFFKLRDDEIAD